MKVRIKEVPKGWKRHYLTIGKEYDFTPCNDAAKLSGTIVDDEGDVIFIAVEIGSAHLDGSFWEIIDAGDESEEHLEHAMHHGTEG